jgi:hypothetical protein
MSAFRFTTGDFILHRRSRILSAALQHPDFPVQYRNLKKAIKLLGSALP